MYILKVSRDMSSYTRQNFWSMPHTHTHTDDENTPQTPKDETSQKTTTSHLLQKQTCNYGGSAALVADQRGF